MGLAAARRLAQSLIQAGNHTLFIDLSNQVNGENGEQLHPRMYGFWDVAYQMASIDDAIQTVAHGQLNVMTAGRSRPIASDVGFVGINNLLNSLKNSYDHIVIFENDSAFVKLRSNAVGSFHTCVDLLLDTQHNATTRCQKTVSTSQTSHIDLIRYTLNVKDEVPVLKPRAAHTRMSSYSGQSNHLIRN